VPRLGVLLLIVEYLLRRPLAERETGGSPGEEALPPSTGASHGTGRISVSERRHGSTQGSVDSSGSDSVFGDERGTGCTRGYGGPVIMRLGTAAVGVRHQQHDAVGVLATRKLIRKVVSPPSNRAVWNRMHRTTSAPKLYSSRWGAAVGGDAAVSSGIDRKKDV
jgi:hypothetical protein